MKCPSCGSEMDYEEAKFPCGVWYCECGKEFEGERFLCAIDGDGLRDYEEKLGEEIAQKPIMR